MKNYNLKFKIAVFLLSTFFLLFLISVVLAAETSPQITLTYPWSSEKSPAGLVARFYQIALGLAGAAALGVLIYGAILWTVSGAVTSKQDALEWIKGALWGLVLLLGAYLILYTINPNLVKLGNAKQLFKSVDSKTAPVATMMLSPPVATTTAAPSSDLSSDVQIRQKLSQVSGDKITVNYPEPRTSLNGLRPTTISGLLSLWNKCERCEIVITGGTETAYHAAGEFGHASGYKLDLRPNEALNQTIYNQIAVSCQIPPPANTNCAGLDGNIYRYETNHWDICFQCPR